MRDKSVPLKYFTAIGDGMSIFGALARLDDKVNQAIEVGYVPVGGAGIGKNQSHLGHVFVAFQSMLYAPKEA